MSGSIHRQYIGNPGLDCRPDCSKVVRTPIKFYLILPYLNCACKAISIKSCNVQWKIVLTYLYSNPDMTFRISKPSQDYVVRRISKFFVRRMKRDLPCESGVDESFLRFFSQQEVRLLALCSSGSVPPQEGRRTCWAITPGSVILSQHLNCCILPSKHDLRIVETELWLFLF